MIFRQNAAGQVATFDNGSSEELKEKDFKAMLRRQLMAKTVKVEVKE
jgi:hypothetical protein